MIALLVKYRGALIVLGFVTTILVMGWVGRGWVADMEARAEAAEYDAERARDLVSRERANADDLATRLQEANELIDLQAQSFRAAEAARLEAERIAAQREASLRRSLSQARESDDALSTCLDMRLPDDVLRQLPQ